MTTRWLIVSDIHDNRRAWERLVAHLPVLAPDRLVCLGDVGRDPEILEDLRRREAICISGNWEVSGFRYLPPRLADWVARWPLSCRHGSLLFCHASPDLPAEARDVRSAAALMAARGLHWSRLFPRLHQDEQARWQALAAMEAQDIRLVFHGHTHVQEAWGWTGVRLQRLAGPSFRVGAGSPQQPDRYLVGVGSLGAPLDGREPRFVLYDEGTATVHLERLSLAE